MGKPLVITGKKVNILHVCHLCGVFSTIKMYPVPGTDLYAYPQESFFGGRPLVCPYCGNGTDYFQATIEDVRATTTNILDEIIVASQSLDT